MAYGPDARASSDGMPPLLGCSMAGLSGWDEGPAIGRDEPEESSAMVEVVYLERRWREWD